MIVGLGLDVGWKWVGVAIQMLDRRRYHHEEDYRAAVDE
jgi:hypothetical protein